MRFYQGGPDEFISSLRPDRQKVFISLLSTQKSLGKAFDILHLPYSLSSESIVKKVNNQFVTDADLEEELFYKYTIFSYKITPPKRPIIVVNIRKIFNLKNIFNSIKIIIAQSLWIARIEDIIKDLENKLDTKNLEELFAVVIAIGYLNEYFSLLAVRGKSQEEAVYINQRIDTEKNLGDKKLLTVQKLRKLRNKAQKIIVNF